MAKIFISHSSKDDEIVSFFSKVISTTKVSGIFEEFEKLISGKITAKKIKKDIEASNAVFVIFSRNVQKIIHTRDWIGWEIGVSSNKDIWVFEQNKDHGKLSIISPILKHYVIFELNDYFFNYLYKIVSSYDDSNVLPAVVLGTGLGAILGKGEGATIGALAGFLFSDKSKNAPSGIEIRCSECNSIYNIHLPYSRRKFRCPVCNKKWSINL